MYCEASGNQLTAFIALDATRAEVKLGKVCGPIGSNNRLRRGHLKLADSGTSLTMSLAGHKSISSFRDNCPSSTLDISLSLRNTCEHPFLTLGFSTSSQNQLCLIQENPLAQHTSSFRSMTDEEKPCRHKTWFAVAAFSTISLVSLTSSIPDGADLKDMNKEFKWSVSAASISLSLAALAWFAHAAKDRFVGTTTEGGLVS